MPDCGLLRTEARLAYVALARGDPAAAVTLFLDSAEHYQALGGDRRGFAECVVGLA